MNTEVEILEFLKTKENTGALLLTGQWGCGKSYLVKKLAEKLNTKTSNYHMSIISLFGIDTIPYIALTLTTIFIQNAFFEWSVKGIIIGSLTLLVTILIPIAYKKLRNALKIVIKKKFTK